MSSVGLDPATPTGAVDPIANLTKPSAETQEPITSSSAVLISGELYSFCLVCPSFLLHTDPVLICQGCDLSGLLTFDLESIEPAPSTARHEPRSSTLLCQFQRLKTSLSSPIETLIEDPEEVKRIFEEIKHHLPVSLQLYLWGPVTALPLYGATVKSARQRIDLRRAQLPLKADIADKCQRLNVKKSAFEARTDTSASTAELEALRKELEDLEERVRATKQLIHEKEALIARSKEEAQGFKTQLQADLAEIRALSKQLVTGTDEEDAAEIAAADRVRVDALRALEAFLQ